MSETNVRNLRNAMHTDPTWLIDLAKAQHLMPVDLRGLWPETG